MGLWIALLRGVNVSGAGKLPMAEFRALLGGLGLGEVRTYIQSGNAVFESDRPAAELEAATYDLARTIAGNAPLSLAGMKSIILRALSLRERLEHKDLDEVARRARASADAREGVRAMLEHRKPAFRGE